MRIDGDASSFEPVVSEDDSLTVNHYEPYVSLLCYIVKQNSPKVLEELNMNETFIHDKQYLEMYRYLRSHYDRYGALPTRLQASASFEGRYRDDWEFIYSSASEDAAISKDSLRDTLDEEHTFRICQSIIESSAQKAVDDPKAGAMYLMQRVQELTHLYTSNGVDIVKDLSRFDRYVDRRENQSSYWIPSGFPKLDDYINGFTPGEELVVLFARTGVGKTWALLQMLAESWRSGYNVGLLEPEMTADRVGYRFDALFGHISNKNLTGGKPLEGGDSALESYKEGLLQHSASFLVAHPKDFGGVVTVPTLKSWCESNNIKVLGIDGISYMKDVRGKSTDSTSQTLSNISADLMELSILLGIPVIVVVQSNREGAAVGGKLALENIRDSDGIAYSASMVIGLYRKSDLYHVQVLKNRNGSSDITLVYDWKVDVGELRFVQEGETGSEEDSNEGYRPRRESSPDSSYTPKPEFAGTAEDAF